jgi:hypothetical protein
MGPKTLAMSTITSAGDSVIIGGSGLAGPKGRATTDVIEMRWFPVIVAT